MSKPTIFVSPLSEADAGRIADFSCGDDLWDDELNDFLQNDALRDQRLSYSRTHLFDDEAHRCVGYVTLLANEIEVRKSGFLGLFTDEKTRYKNVPALLIGRIAVRDGIQGQGIGTYILAWVRNLARGLPIGCRFLALHVDTKNTDAIRFYEREGFLKPPTSKNLVLMLYDMIASP